MTSQTTASGKFRLGIATFKMNGSFLAIGLLFCGVSHQVSAQTYSWINGKITNWSDTASWMGGNAPVSSADTIISFSGITQNSTGTNDLGSIQLNRLIAGVTGTKSLTIAGSAGNNLDFVKSSSDVLPTLQLTKSGTGAVNVSVPFTVTDALTITNSGTDTGLVVISGAITNTGGMIFDGSGVSGVRLGNGIVSGVGGITHNGSYTLTLSGAHTYTGETKVSAGTLALSAANRIANTSNLVMDGGTFSTGGFAETLGTLTLTANSIIDLGNAAVATGLVFSDSHNAVWSASVGLSFVNFTEGLDTIRIGTTSGGLTSEQLAQITINGSAAAIDGNGFLTISSVPEPSTYGVVLGAIALAGVVVRRRRQGGV